MYQESSMAPARRGFSLSPALRLALVALLAVAALPATAALSFDAALAQLTSEDFAEREAGEGFFRALAQDDTARLEALVDAPEPEVAFRARRALLYVRLRLNDPFPADLATKIAALPDMSGRDVRATLTQLLNLKPLPLITLAGLHSEVLNNPNLYSRIDGDTLKNLAEAITVTAASKSETLEISQIRAQNYSDQTLALLADGFARRQGNELGPIIAAYSSWVTKRPAILPLLAGAAIPLELARIQVENAAPNPQITTMITLAAAFPDPCDQRKAILARVSQTLRANPQFPIESLDREQGYNLFAALEDNWDPQMDVGDYRKFRERFPEPRPKPDASTLEAIYLLDKQGANAALVLSLSQPNDHAAVWLGTHLLANPDKIPNTLVLPALQKNPNGQTRPRTQFSLHLCAFLNALVPPSSLPEMESNPKAMAAFVAILRDDQWLASLSPNTNDILQKLIILATKYANPKLRESPAFAAALRAVNRYRDDALSFSTSLLSAEEGYLFFKTFCTTAKAKKSYGGRYRTFRQRFTEEPPEVESLPLEALIFLDAAQPNKAFALSLLQESTAAAEWTGEWLNEHPEAMEKAFPLPNGENWPRRQCGALLKSLAPYRTLAECQAHPKQMAALKVLIDTPEWLDAGLRGDSSRIVCLQILLAGDLDRMVSTRLSGQPGAVTELGSLLAEQPEMLRSIKPENQTAASLRPLVLGLSQANANPQQRAEINKVLEEWAKTIPAVLDKPAPVQKPRPEGNGF